MANKEGNKFIRAAKRLAGDPRKILVFMNSAHMLDCLSDEKALRALWWGRFGKKLDLSRPESFNEKMQWLKLYDRDELHTRMADKIKAKEIVAGLAGEKYVIPSLGVWNSPDEIDFEALPDRFVLKCNHTSGEGIYVCKDKATFDTEKAKKGLGKALRSDYFKTYREWPYKDIERKVFAEEYMEDRHASDLGQDSLPVYKFFCFEGSPEIIQTIQNDKKPNETIDYFDCCWNRLDLRQNYPNSPVPTEKPEALEEMLSLAKTFSAGHHFLRVDLYQINGKVYFSEFTFFSDGGFAPFYPESWNRKLGDMIKIP